MLEEHHQNADSKSTEVPSLPEIPPELRTKKKDQPKKSNQSFTPPLGSARELAGIGLEITGSMVGLGGIGWLLDYWIGSMPWFMLVGLILGIIGGLYNAIKKINKITQSNGYEYHYKKRRKNTANSTRSDQSVDQ